MFEKKSMLSTLKNSPIHQSPHLSAAVIPDTPAPITATFFMLSPEVLAPIMDR